MTRGMAERRAKAEGIAGGASPCPPCRSLDASTLPDLVAQVRPRPEEERWLRIPWVPSLHAGRLEALRRNPPIFLWAMNGNPLGCV